MFRRPLLFQGARAVLVLCLLALAGLGIYTTLCWTLWKKDIELSAIQRYLEEYRLEDARKQLEVSLAQWPNEVQLHLLAARRARLAEDYQGAAFQLDQCMELSDSSDAYSLEFCLLQTQRGNMTCENDLQKRVVENDKDKLYILEALAEGYRKNYRLQQSTYCLKLWLKERPGTIRAYYKLAWIYEQTQNVHAAIKTYREIVQLEPGEDEARAQLAVLLVQGYEAKEALSHLQHLYRRRPEDITLLVHLARCLYQLGQIDQAKTFLQKANAKNPKDPMVMQELGSFAMAEGHFSRAEPLLRQAVAASPYSFLSNFKLCQCLQRLGKKAEARRYESRCKQIQEDMAHLHATMTKLARRPNDPALRCRAGMIFLRQGQEENGVRWLKSALLEDAHYRCAHQALAAYYFRKGDTHRAKEHSKFAGVKNDH